MRIPCAVRNARAFCFLLKKKMAVDSFKLYRFEHKYYIEARIKPNKKVNNKKMTIHSTQK